MGFECSCLLGMGYHQLRFLDRYRPRRNTDFRHSFSNTSEMADFGQPIGRSDDNFCRDLRRDLSRLPRG